MRAFLKVAPVAAIIAIAALGAMSGNQASAAEFCRQDVTGHMTSCGFDTMEQCKAASAGIGGDCFRDPSLNAGRPANLLVARETLWAVQLIRPRG